MKRIYDPPEPDDGLRYLVERLWPRGMKKESVKVDGWLKEVAPSPQLRTWFSHDPAKWKEFQRRYFAELNNNPSAWIPLVEAEQKGNLTLLFSARDIQHNSAVALKNFLLSRIRRQNP